MKKIEGAAVLDEWAIQRFKPDAGWRYELKLTCDAELLAQARTWINTHPESFRTTYPARIVNNIYLDTLDLSSLRANLSGFSEKRKLRIRWYDSDLSNAILELKVKQNWLGSKARFDLPAPLDLSQSWSQIMMAVTRNAPRRWQHLLQTINQPTLINRYRREYFATPDGDLRATLDYAQEFFDQSFSLRPNYRRRLLMERTVVIELKAEAHNLERLQRVCSQFPIRLSRNSKYAGSLLAALNMR